jgi:Holliday junction DNA helicase RuvA
MPRASPRSPASAPATADRIIAKLRRKVPKFALLVAGEVAAATGMEIERDLLTQAFEVLRVLGHTDADARRLLDGALDKKTKYKDVDALLHAVYEKSHGA